MLPCPCFVTTYLTFPACILSIVIIIPGWPSGSKLASAIVLRRAVDETIIPGKKVFLMIFAYVDPVTGKYEEDSSPLGDVSVWVAKSQVTDVSAWVAKSQVI